MVTCQSRCIKASISLLTFRRLQVRLRGSLRRDTASHFLVRRQISGTIRGLSHMLSDDIGPNSRRMIGVEFLGILALSRSLPRAAGQLDCRFLYLERSSLYTQFHVLIRGARR